LIKITTDDGLTGVGAAPDTGVISMTTIADMVAPYIIGKEIFSIEQISPILRNASHDGSYPWGVEIALWDLIGKCCGQPVYHLWGKYQDRLPVYASMAEIQPADVELKRIADLRAIGFKAFKLRLRRPDVSEDIAFVKHIRRELGSDVTLMVDCNQAHVMPSPGPHNVWSLETALKVIHEMHTLDITWVEEPLHRYNYQQLAELRLRSDVPIAGGELNQGLHEYRQIIDQNCYDIIQADAAFSEGVFQLRKVAAYAELHYKSFIPHNWSNGIGLLANLHLAGSIPNCPWFEYPIDPPAWTIEARDFMLRKSVQIEADGTIRVPDQPGFGIEIDDEAVRKYSVKNWSSDNNG